MERDMTEIPVAVAGRNLSGRPLRRVLTAALADAAGPMGISDLVRVCESIGVHWGDDRASKLISDSLRWEIDWGRVRRVGRGRYEFAGAPDTTLRRIRRQAAQVEVALAVAGEMIREAALDPDWEWELRDQLNLSA